MRKGRNLYAGAYFTVEASFIVPMALAVLIMAIYLTCFACGRCKLVQDGMILCIRESSQKSEQAQGRIRELYAVRKGSYLMFSEAGADLSRGGRVRAALSGQLHLIPAPALSGSGGKSLGIAAQIETPAHDPPAKYRKYRRLTYMAGRILKGSEDGKEEE